MALVEALGDIVTTVDRMQGVVDGESSRPLLLNIVVMTSTGRFLLDIDYEVYRSLAKMSGCWRASYIMDLDV